MSKLKKQTKHLFRSFGELLRHGSFYRWTLAVSLVLFVLMLALPIWRIVPLAQEKPFIPLHYNVYFGVDRFGPWYQIFILPALGFLFFLINLIFQSHFSLMEKMLTRFFAASTVLLQGVLLVAMCLIVLLNV